MKVKISLLILVLIVIGLYVKYNKTSTYLPVPIVNKTEQILKLGQLGNFEKVSIKPISIEEDSRCPIDVQCIQAGTVRVKIEVSSNNSSDTSIVKLGEEFTTKDVKIILTNVSPITNSKIKIEDNDYRLTFKVVDQDVSVPGDVTGKCYIGGCSSQICSDKPDQVSTCEYREQYACYKTAVCERQSTGLCGWTQTEELRICLGRGKTILF